MSRAALLPTIADPSVLTFWWHFFESVWQDEVDRLYVYVGTDHVSLKILNYIQELVGHHPKVIFKYLQGLNDHGPTLAKAVVDSTEEYLMFVEEDAFIFKKGEVDKYFRKLESGEYDFIGSPRGSVNMNIYNAEMKKFDVPAFEGYDNGPNFWPNFVFTTRDLITKTDLHFNSKDWKKGDYIKELDYIVQDDVESADTFSWMSMQIRSLTNKIGICPQYKAYPFDPVIAEAKQWTFSDEAGWIHAGSISSGMGHYLRNKDKTPLAMGLHTPIPFQKIEDEGQRNDFEMRVAWWSLMLEYSWHKLFMLGDFKARYRDTINRLKEDMELHQEEIDKRMKLYKKLLRIL